MFRNLQDRMLQQKVEDDNIPRVGGSRWKSAREDKGTIRAYAKDVQEKHKKQSTKNGKPNINLLTGKPMFSKISPSPLDVSAASMPKNDQSVKIDYMSNVSPSASVPVEVDRKQVELEGSGDCGYGYEHTGEYSVGFIYIYVYIVTVYYNCILLLPILIYIPI